MERKRWEASKQIDGEITDYFYEVVEEGYASGLVFKVSYFKGGEEFVRIRDMRKLADIKDDIGKIYNSEHLRVKHKRWEAKKRTDGRVTDYFIEEIEESDTYGFVFKISCFNGGEKFIRLRDVENLKNIKDAINEVFTSELMRRRKKTIERKGRK